MSYAEILRSRPFDPTKLPNESVTNYIARVRGEVGVMVKELAAERHNVQQRLAQIDSELKQLEGLQNTLGLESDIVEERGDARGQPGDPAPACSRGTRPRRASPEQIASRPPANPDARHPATGNRGRTTAPPPSNPAPPVSQTPSPSAVVPIDPGSTPSAPPRTSDPAPPATGTSRNPRGWRDV